MSPKFLTNKLMEKLKRRLVIIGANRFNSKGGLDSDLKQWGLPSEMENEWGYE